MKHTAKVKEMRNMVAGIMTMMSILVETLIVLIMMVVEIINVKKSAGVNIESKKEWKKKDSIGRIWKGDNGRRTKKNIIIIKCNKNNSNILRKNIQSHNTLNQLMIYHFK